MSLAARQRKGKILHVIFLMLTVFAVLVLGILLGGIIDRSFGFVAMQNVVEFEDLSSDGSTFDAAGDEILRAVLQQEVRPMVLETIIAKVGNLESLSGNDLRQIVVREVLQPEVARSWSLLESIFSRSAILAEMENTYPDAGLTFRSWVHLDFLNGSQSMDPMQAGIRGAVIGTFFTIVITMLVAFPLGVGAAIWLEEYAPDNMLTRFIQTNIYNLAGVPSIIYGMLGLSIFVRSLADITQGRTILSAALTLAILVLPIIIINAQEALKAVPQSLRHAGYALGATRWQIVWNHVLPASMDRILTGTVLGMSRAIGETAPLVVVGASAFLTHDPSSLFDRFTTLPIQIYQWTSLPNEAYRNLAAAAILVLMILLVGLNAFAIIMRNRYRKENKI